MSGGAIDPAKRGYGVLYRANETNHCPGCGRSQWLIGRLMAECAFCGTPLALEETTRHSEISGGWKCSGKGGGIVRRMAFA